jgi:hypothetical protein
MVTASSPGLEPASLRIESIPPEPGRASGIIEPAAGDGEAMPGIPVSWQGGTSVSTERGAIRIFFEDLRYPPLGLAEYRDKLDFRIHAENPKVRADLPAYGALLDELAGLLVKGEGVLIADDCNFAVKRFNALLEG